jgi:hypothetical protein
MRLALRDLPLFRSGLVRVGWLAACKRVFVLIGMDKWSNL